MITVATTQANDEVETMMKQMILRPLDFSLLRELESGRNVAANLYVVLDVSRPYVNERLGMLADYGLLRRVGPNESAGLYEITDEGRAALKLQDDYGEVDDFEALVQDELSSSDQEA